MHFGYGDSTRTPHGQYIVAAFRADANLAWVVDLRSFLSLAELKYRDYGHIEIKSRVAANGPLYRNVMNGLQQAEITVVDPRRYLWEGFFRYRDMGASFGEDYTNRDLYRLASHSMLRASPLGLPSGEHMLDLPMNESFGTKALTSSDGALSELEHYDEVEEIHQRSGGKLTDAIVLSARAHSMLSPSEFLELKVLVRHPYMRPPMAEVMRNVSRLGRVFDHEHEKSVPILNELVPKVASLSGVPGSAAYVLSLRNSVREEASHTSDHLQAADFAAGWASELLTATDSDYRALANKVRWLSVNGICYPG